MEIGYCVSGKGRVVEAIWEAKRLGLLKSDCIAIVDRPGPFIATAERYHVPVHLLDRHQYSDKENFRQDLTRLLLSLDLEALFLTFDWILPPDVVSRYSPNLVNLHMALLPLFRGRGAIEAAATSGMTIAGVTYHLVDEGVDTGPIIAQGITPIAGMDSAEVGAALFRKALPLGIQTARWLEDKRLSDISSRRVNVADARFDDGPFFPALDADIAEFSRDFLARHYPMPGRNS